jgi:hypothetical protein
LQKLKEYSLQKVKAVASALIDLYLATIKLDLQPLDYIILLQDNYQIYLDFEAEDIVLVSELPSNQRYLNLSAYQEYAIAKRFYSTTEIEELHIGISSKIALLAKVFFYIFLLAKLLYNNMYNN